MGNSAGADEARLIRGGPNKRNALREMQGGLTDKPSEEEQRS